MQDEEAGGHKRSAEGLRSTLADRLGPATWGCIVRDRSGTVAWSEQYTRYRGRGRELVSLEHLNLGHAVTLRLVGRQPYQRALAGCTLEIPSLGLASPFHVIRATFPFYRTGEAVLTGVLLVLDDGRPLSLPEAVKLLTVPVPAG